MGLWDYGIVDLFFVIIYLKKDTGKKELLILRQD